MAQTTWRKKITKEIEHRDDSWDNVIQSYWEPLKNPAALDLIFDSSYGTSQGVPFILLDSHLWVYFPVVYDGCDWVGSVAA